MTCHYYLLRKQLCKFLFLTLAFSAYDDLVSQNVKILGNINDQPPYASIILSPARPSKLIDDKIEFAPKRGAFEFNIQIKEPQFYKLYYKTKRISLYLEPDKTIRLSIDHLKENDAVNFFEDLASENIFLNMDRIPQIGTLENKKMLKHAAKQSMGEYVSLVDTMMLQSRYRLIEATESHNLSVEFIDLYQKNNIDMMGLFYQSLYPRMAGLNLDSFYANDVSVLHRLDTSLEEAIISAPVYIENLLTKIKILAKQNLRNEVNTLQLDQLNLYKKYYNLTGTIHNITARKIIQEEIIGDWLISHGSPGDLQVEIDDLIKNEEDNQRKESIRKKIAFLSNYENGRPAPLFSYEDASENIRNLKSYVGKAVYIYFFDFKSDAQPQATIIDLTSSLGKDSSLVILGISLEEDKGEWNLYLSRNQINSSEIGIAHPGGFQSDVALKYNIIQLPSAVLIDANGNFIAAKAPLPNNPSGLLPLLKKIIKK